MGRGKPGLIDRADLLADTHIVRHRNRSTNTAAWILDAEAFALEILTDLEEAFAIE
jgi:hypothetical protein